MNYISIKLLLLSNDNNRHWVKWVINKALGKGMGDSQGKLVQKLQQVKLTEPGNGLFEETKEKTKVTPRFLEERKQRKRRENELKDIPGHHGSYAIMRKGGSF